MSARPSDAEQRAYADVCQEVKGRLQAAYYFLSDDAQAHFSPLVGRNYATECAALQLRKVLELLLLGSLLTNGSALEKSKKALSKKSADDARKLVEQMNPDFWPEPVHQRPGVGAVKYLLAPISEGFLRREAYGPAFGLTSSWCHARNPLAEPLDILDGRTRLRKLEKDLRRLVNHFTVTLVDRDAMLVCQMAAFPVGADMIGEGEVQVTLMERI